MPRLRITSKAGPVVAQEACSQIDYVDGKAQIRPNYRLFLGRVSASLLRLSGSIDVARNLALHQINGL